VTGLVSKVVEISPCDRSCVASVVSVCVFGCVCVFMNVFPSFCTPVNQSVCVYNLSVYTTRGTFAVYSTQRVRLFELAVVYWKSMPGL
jgi:hypothetical protein